jgi:aryl-alcohol dehydrogenase-like predicted oxidoreductase
MPGATEAGTEAYRVSHPAAPGHYRQGPGGAWLSSLGIGTYLGSDDERTDVLYAAAVTRALELGINVVDSAINYRNQRSERAIGQALREVPREQVYLCTKGGFLPLDGHRPHDLRAYIEETFVRPGILRPEDIVDGCHSIAPRFLADQIERSRRNLGVETIDLYQLHNPETQLGEVPRDEFLRRLRRAFEELERACDDGRIAAYGTATWNGYRLEPGDEEALSLDEVLAAARDAGGERHRFAAIQLPFNLEMDEAATLRNQRGRTVLQAAAEAGVAVFTSASLLQGKLAAEGRRALQSVRSTSGVICALVGMKSRLHVEANAALVGIEPMGATV